MLGNWGRQNLERSKEAFEQSQKIIKTGIDRATKELAKNLKLGKSTLK